MRLPVIIGGEVLEYTKRGGHFEVLIVQSLRKGTRHKLIPAKAVPDFDTTKPAGINLAHGTQRGTQKDEIGKFKFHVKGVRALKGVA